MLVGHADAAVHLDALLHRESGGGDRLGLGDAGHQLGARVVAVDEVGGLVGGGASDLDLPKQVGGAVLQGLELADQPAELLALLEVIDRHVGRAGRNADQFGGRSSPAGGEGALERGPAAIDLADDRIGVDTDAVEGQARRLAVVGEGDVLRVEAVCAALDREQGDAVPLARRAGGAGGHQDDVGRGAVNHELLGAAQGEAVAGAAGFEGGLLGRVALALVGGEGGDGLPGKNAGEPTVALRGTVQGSGGGDGGGEKGRGG